MQKMTQIKTVRTETYNGLDGRINSKSDDEVIEMLTAEGWKIFSIQHIAYIDSTGDYAVPVEVRYVTLTREV